MGFDLSEVKTMTLGIGIKPFPSHYFNNCTNLEMGMCLRRKQNTT